MREAICILFETIQKPVPSTLEPESQQPYRLHILRLVGAVTDDPDMALLHFMEHGVPTGVTSPIPTSHQWPPATEQSEMEASTPLDLCDGNWKAATDHPTEVAALIQKEIDNGWVLEANMSVTEAQQRWPTGTAVGKLNIVFAEGKEPRLVLDSTICGVNPRCHLPERVALPMASDIRLATHASDHHGAFVEPPLTLRQPINRSRSGRQTTDSSSSSITTNYTTTESAISEADSQPIGGNG